MEQLELMPARIKIAAIVRKAILSGEFAAGAELSLTETAAKIGVSRTPVREAFQTLAAEGLIELRMNKGAVVKPIDENFIRDHFGIRMLLEGEAVARAIQNKMDANTLKTLQAAVLAEQNFVIGDAYELYNQKFHTAIWMAAKSQKLYHFCETLWNGPSFSRAVPDEEHRRKSIAEHNQIITFIANKNAEEGRKAMTAHIERSMHNILDGFNMR
ncbi:HTH-type transcriptional repressor RspR [anaerobic digester metagenome]